MGWRGPTKAAPGRKFTQGAVSVDDRELLRQLGRLEKVTQRRVTQKILRRSGAPIRADAKRRVPVKTGRLKRSIKTYTKIQRYRAEGRVESREPYAHLVELGTSAHFQKRKLRHEKRARRFLHPGAKPKPFLRPAFDSHKDEAVGIAKNTLREEIDKIAKG